MTPQELVGIAKQINPQKYVDFPAEALMDAYTFAEALRLAKIEAEVRELGPTMTHGPKKKLSTLDHLREYIVKNSTTPSRISKKLKISSSAIYGWLNGNLKPSVDSIAKIEAFLHDVGYYE